LPPINPELIKRLQERLALGKRQIYTLISRKAGDTFLPRELAAIALAAEKGINILKYASSEDLQNIRQTVSKEAPVIHTVSVPQQKPTRSSSAPKTGAKKAGKLRRGNSVFVVYGRNHKLRRSLFAFLRSVGLNPIEWQQAIAKTGKPSPYVGEILETAFREAVAVVVLFSPDDEAKLKDKFIKQSDPSYEKGLTGQARPNVLFEAGMAFGRNPESTVLVQIGQVRPFSDVAGRHIVHLSDSTESRQEFITKLANAGCNVNTDGTDWHSEGDFTID